MVPLAARAVDRGSADGARPPEAASPSSRPARAWWGLAVLCCVVPGCSYNFDAAFSGAAGDAGDTSDANVGGTGGSGLGGASGSAGVSGSGGGAGQSATGGAAGQDAATEDVAAGDAPADVADAAQEAEAAAPTVSAVKQVLHGTAQLIAIQDQVEVAIPGVDPARAFLVFGVRVDGGTPSNSLVSGSLTSPTKLVFQRVGGGASAMKDVSVVWHVAEFSEGVSVQRGSVQLGSGLSVTVDLPSPIDPAKSFPLVTLRNTGLYYGTDDITRADLVSDTQLTLSRTAGSGAAVAEWQVVTFDGCHVQSGHVGLIASQTTSSAVVAGADPSRTWLLLSYSLNHPDTAVPTQSYFLRGAVSPGLLSFARSGADGNLDAVWYAVTFDNGSTVHSGQLGFTPSESTSATDPLGIDPARAFALSSGMWERSGTTAFSGTQPGMATYTFDLTNPGVVSIGRGTTGAESTVSWSAVEFAK